MYRERSFRFYQPLWVGLIALGLLIATLAFSLQAQAQASPQDNPPPPIQAAQVSDTDIWKGSPVITGAHFVGRIIIQHTELNDQGKFTGEAKAFACTTSAIEGKLILLAIHCPGWNQLDYQSSLLAWNSPLGQYYPREEIFFFLDFGAYNDAQFDIHPQIGWVHIVWDAVDPTGTFPMPVDIMIIVPTQKGTDEMDTSRDDFDTIHLLPVELKNQATLINAYGFGQVDPGSQFLHNLNQTGFLPVQFWESNCHSYPYNLLCVGTPGKTDTTSTAHGDSGGPDTVVISGTEYQAGVTSRYQGDGLQQFFDVDLTHPTVRAEVERIIVQEAALPRPTKQLQMRNFPQFVPQTTGMITQTAVNQGRLELSASSTVITTGFGSALQPRRVDVRTDFPIQGCLGFSTEPHPENGNLVLSRQSLSGSTGKFTRLIEQIVAPQAITQTSKLVSFLLGTDPSCGDEDPTKALTETAVVTTNTTIYANLLDEAGRGDMPMISTVEVATHTVTLPAQRVLVLPVYDLPVLLGQTVTVYANHGYLLTITKEGADLRLVASGFPPNSTILVTLPGRGVVTIQMDEQGAANSLLGDIYKQIFLPTVRR